MVTRPWHTHHMRLRVLVPVVSFVLMGMTSCASVGVTASRSDSDAWAGCVGERATLNQIEEQLSPFPLAPTPRLRPLSMTEPCSTIRQQLEAARRDLRESHQLSEDPGETQIYGTAQGT